MYSQNGHLPLKGGTKKITPRGPRTTDIAPSATQTSSLLWPLMAMANKPGSGDDQVCVFCCCCFCWTHDNLLPFVCVGGLNSICVSAFELESGWMKSCDKHWWICSTDMSPASQSTDHRTSGLNEWKLSTSTTVIYYPPTSKNHNLHAWNIIVKYVHLDIFLCLKIEVSMFFDAVKRSGIGDRALLPGSTPLAKQPWSHKQYTSYSWDSYLLTIWGTQSFSLNVVFI